MKRLLCKIGWHSRFAGFDFLYSDGCSAHVRCRWCGGEGMLDSNGGIFGVKARA